MLATKLCVQRPALTSLAATLAIALCPAAPARAMGTSGPPTPTSAPVEYCADREGDGFYDPNDCVFFSEEGVGPAELFDMTQYVVFRRKDLVELIDNCPQDTNTDQLDTDDDGVGDVCEYLDVSVGANHACAIRSNGTVSCWGNNEFGQASAPVWSFSQIAVGRNHSCGILNSSSAAQKGRVMCWGDNEFNQLGARGGQYERIRANGDVTCAVDKDGKAACWGACGDDASCHPSASNKFIEVTPAFDVTPVDSDTPLYGYCAIDNQWNLMCGGGRPPTQPPTGKYFGFDAGDRYGCALAPGGAISCWAREVQEPGSPPDPMLAPPAGAFSFISVGLDHACAVGFDRQIKCWGSNAFQKSQPPSGTFEAIAVGDSHACARATNGGISCWGDHGVLSGPVRALKSGNKLLATAPLYMEISANEYVACAVSIGRQLSCSSLAMPKYFVPQGEFWDVTVGEGKSCGYRTDGMTVCWNGATGETEELPGVGKVAIRRYHAVVNGVSEPREYLCGIFKSTGKLFCRDHGAPTPAEGSFQFGPSFKEVGVMGQRTACGITADQRFLCQDYRAGTEREVRPGSKFYTLSCNSGKCCASGDADTHCYEADGAVTKPDYYYLTNLSIGPSHGCGLFPSGKTARCWGDPSDTSGARTPPNRQFFDLSAGTGFSCGLVNDGSALCWGQVRETEQKRDYRGKPIVLTPVLGTSISTSVSRTLAP